MRGLRTARRGYCIAGIMMRAQALLQRNSKPTDQRIRAELAPHLCRCGTHMRILRAVRRAAQMMGGTDSSSASHGGRYERSPNHGSPSRVDGRWRHHRELLSRPNRGTAAGAGWHTQEARQPRDNSLP
ncbi:2Fe-2S iron-sulfur cluster-binding protein [Bradyrhizobium hipponense]|uniref:2Fe-2S iron-sulfur cluster-binding protein n=1 Tax=Bradyrhizobium hipponense TaxID=2605638 RepID=UPI003D31F1AC